MKKNFKHITQSLSVILITYLLFALLLQFIVTNKFLSKHSSKIHHLSSVYYSFNINVQFHPNCSQYDSELFYTMKPGSCKFVTSEFAVTHHNNIYGLRDMRNDISQTEIITLGDSFTLGYGVEQDETFAAVIEKNTGMKTLNAGISSYGTARESIMLDRLLKTGKLSQLKYIVLQYCNNDYLENDKYVSNNFNLRVGPEFSSIDKNSIEVDLMKDMISPGNVAYNDIVRKMQYYGEHNSIRRIFYGNFITMFGRPKATFTYTIKGATEDNKQYRDFLDIVQKKIIGNKLLPHNVKLVIFDIEPHNVSNPFYQNIKGLLQEKKYKNIKDRILLVNIPSILTNDDYYPLDGHTHVMGNKKVGDKISEFIE